MVLNISCLSRRALAQPQCLSQTLTLLTRSRAITRSHANFTSSARQLKKPATNASHKIKAKMPPARTPPPTARAPEYQSYAAKLAATHTPTLLYLAPSHTLFIATAYGGAAFCLTYAGINYVSVVHYTPPDLATWIPYAFTGVCFVVSCFGGYLLMAPLNVIKSIKAVPYTVKAAAPTVTKAIAAGAEATATKAGKGAVAAKALQTKTAAAAGAEERTIHLEVALRSLIPFLPNPKVLVKPEQCTLNMPLYYPLHSLPPAQRQAMEQRALALKRKEQEAEREKSILTAPFRHASQAFFALMKATQRIWTREGFLDFKVGTKTYKLDISGGWALDEGRALDRLVKSTKSAWQK